MSLRPHRFLARAAFSLCLLLGASAARADTSAAWFETFKDNASGQDLLRFLHAMPKGGDLHNHIGGSVHPEWYYQMAMDAAKHGYRFHTKTSIRNCRVGTNEYGGDPYLLMFRTITDHDWRKLPECERAEYTPLEDLDAATRAAWMSSLVLDQPHEGRAEFFEGHWQRLNGLLESPQIAAETIVRNMQAFADEGMTYLEPQVDLQGFKSPDGTPWTPDQVLDLYRARLAQPDAKATGVTVRMQLSVLRFTDGAEDQLRTLYELAARHPEIVAVNMVGREDDDKGYPLRFLATMREMRRKYSGVNLSIHAGEVDEPNFHVRDTLLLGADRIGHGVNLITDPETMLLMRWGKQLVEINLISNLLLEYVDDYSQHPFPEYLRFGIPVALSTDDRGMWDSTMTDEFFVAVREFDLSWEEVLLLSRNSIAYGFLPEAEKARLLTDFDRRIRAFERRFADGGLEAVATRKPQYRGFICRRYKVCDPDA